MRSRPTPLFNPFHLLDTRRLARVAKFSGLTLKTTCRAVGLQHPIARSAISGGQLRKAAKARSVRINKKSSVIGS